MPAEFWMVGTPIGNLGDLTQRAQSLLRQAEVVACEDTRRTGILLKHVGGQGRLLRADAHKENSAVPAVLAALNAGQCVVFVSDAGMPVVSDPGHAMVQAVRDAGYRVQVAPGPSAVSAALALSGFAAQQYHFAGFLPRKKGERNTAAVALSSIAVPVVLFLSPHRLQEELRSLADAMPERRAVCCRELTKLHEEVTRGALAELAQADLQARGEYTVVLGPVAGAVHDATRAELEDWCSRLRTRGLTGRALADTLSEICGIPRREAYQYVLDSGDD